MDEQRFDLLLEEAWQSGSISTRPKTACLSEEQICRVVFQDATEPEVQQLVEHSITCASCRQDWSMALDYYRDFRKGAARMEPGVSIQASQGSVFSGLKGSLRKYWRKHSIHSNKLGWQLACAGSMLGLLLVVVVRPEIRSSGKTVYRGIDGSESNGRLFQSSSAFRLTDHALEWPSAGEDCSYVVHVYDEEMRPLLQSGVLRETTFKIDEVLKTKFGRSQSFSWTVTAGGVCTREVSPVIRSSVEGR